MNLLDNTQTPKKSKTPGVNGGEFTLKFPEKWSSTPFAPVEDKRVLYFNEKLHKYTDDMKNPYTSMTTIIDKYYKHFDTDGVARACERIGRNPRHPKYLKYKGKSAAQIKAGWKDISDTALDQGNEKHDYLETSVKTANGYLKTASGIFVNDRIYTVDDIVDPEFDVGLINAEWLRKTGMANRYPEIYMAIITLMKAGYRIYAEVGVYNATYLVSGLIDLIAIKGDRFIIIDWKTNKADIRFESGYYEKDMAGNLTDVFIHKNDYMFAPLHMLPDSVGNHYNLQVSGYTLLVEQFGVKSLGNIIYQIRVDPKGGLEQITKIPLNDYRQYALNMFKHHYDSLTLNTQKNLFY